MILLNLRSRASRLPAAAKRIVVATAMGLALAQLPLHAQGDAPAAPTPADDSGKPTEPAKRSRSAKSPKSAACIASVAGTTKYGGRDAFKTYKLKDLFGKDGLVATHPLLGMDAAQRATFVLQHTPSRKIMDPIYGVRQLTYYPILSEPSAATGNRYIVGQFEALSDLGDLLISGSSGDQTLRKKTIGIVGPSGTGKTELGKVITAPLQRLSNSNPHYKRFSFRFVGLERIPWFVNRLPKTEGTITWDHQMGRSPLILVPEEMQREILEDASSAEIKSKLRSTLRVFNIPDPHSEFIVTKILDHEIRARKLDPDAITNQDVLEILNDYVEVFPIPPTLSEPDRVIRLLGDNPNWHEYLSAEVTWLSMTLGLACPLAYQYSGKILRRDGEIIAIDEFNRNPQDVRDKFLDMSQNRVADHGGAPAVQFDSLMMAMDNDESIAKSVEEGAAKASNDRNFVFPMRYSMHPNLTKHIALLSVGLDRFEMQALPKNGSKDEQPIVPANILDLFPPPTETGLLKGPEGRYNLFHRVGDKRVFIAPQALQLMGLTAVATRFITNPEKLQAKLKGEFPRTAETMNYFTNPVARLKVILREDVPSEAVRSELHRIRLVLEEGSSGISERDIGDTWLPSALAAAREHGMTLTPYLVDRVFIHLIDQGTIKVDGKGLTRAELMKIYQRIKIEILLPAMARDVQAIVAGNTDQAQRLYKELEQEIRTLVNKPKAIEYDTGRGSPRPINFSRLEEIRKVYALVNGRQLHLDDLSSFFISTGTSDPHPGLMRAVEQYLVDSSINSTAVQGLIEAFEGSTNVDTETTRLAETIRRNLVRYGYNEISFVEALKLMYDLNYQKKQMIEGAGR